MKNIYGYLFLLAFILVLKSCKHRLEGIDPENTNLVEFLSLEDDVELQNIVNHFQSSVSSSRVNSLLNQVDFSQSVKRLNPETGNTHYSFKMESIGLISNHFILIENNIGNVSGHIFQYEIDRDWFNDADEFTGWHEYSGVFRILDLNGKILTENLIRNGSSESPSSARTASTVCSTSTTRICTITPYGQHCYYETQTSCINMGNGSGWDNDEPDSFSDNPTASQTSLMMNDDPTSGTSCDYGRDNLGNCLTAEEACNEDPLTTWENGECKCVFGEGENGCLSECIDGPCCGITGEELLRCLDDIPCPGDPLVGMEITSPGSSGTNGGRYGCTRFGSHPSCEPGRKFHDGIDLTAGIGSYVFAAFPGKVVQVKNSLEPLEYAAKSYGNYVIIESTQFDGTVFRMKYNHLDFLDMVVGQTVDIGMLLGRTGATGNASSNRVIPHLHLQASVKVGGRWLRTNPEDFLTTAYDENGEKIYDPCIE